MAASSPPAPAIVSFSALAHHLEEQIRGATDPATVNRYRLAMKAGEEFPPLVVADVAGALVLVDGFHRSDAMEALDIGEAPARIIACASLQEARWRGFEANLRHGQPLRPKHLRPALGADVEAGQHRGGRGRAKSYREMARDVPGVSYGTIRRWIEADYPELFAELGGGESAAPGGLQELPAPLTPEESVEAAARDHIAEARALLTGLSGKARRRAAVDVEALLGVLRWDEGETGGVDLEGFL